MTTEQLDQLVEKVRAASFEAPKAHSHSEWKRRIVAILEEAASLGSVDTQDALIEVFEYQSADPARVIDVQRSGPCMDSRSAPCIDPLCYFDWPHPAHS